MSEANPYKQAAKAIKAKGLLKLKFYCQMCQKQCRDAAGFKAHTLSESHQRQIQIFRSNPAKFINQFSEEFKKGFLDILKTRHGKKQVQALRVYNEYINDRHHVHMNSTQWTSLSSFVKYLGKTGICKVKYDEEKETWFLQYVGSESNLYNTPNGSSTNENDDIIDEKRKFELYERQFKALKELEEHADEIIQQEENENKDVTKKPAFSGFSLSKKRANSSSGESDPSSSTQQEIKNSEEFRKEEENLSSSSLNESSVTQPSSSKKMKPNIEEEGVSSGWLKTGIILKIVDKSSEFFNEKALVLKTLKKKRVAQVELLSDSSKIVEVSQDNLQTVIPKIGAKVMILKHDTMRGKTATLTNVDFTKACATVQVDGVLGDSHLVLGYDDISKIF